MRTGAERELRRCLKFVGRGAVSVLPEGNDVRLQGGAGSSMRIKRRTLAEMASAGLITRNGTSLVLTDAGARRLARETASTDPFISQHQEQERITIETAAGRQAVLSNAAESPLTQLFRRKDRNGRPFLETKELRAGERLRLDFTRAQMMPSMGANWSGFASAGARGTPTPANVEITEAAMTARSRVEAALAAVGPELSGILVDVCCFLKGLETVEGERGWPARSAKIVLKTALAALGRHYFPTGTGAPRPAVLHWGADDYRPRMNGAVGSGADDAR